MNWRKLDLIFRPDAPWLTSHAALPVSLRVKGDVHRVFFCGRDDRNRARVGWFEFDIRNPTEIIRTSREPVIGLGPLGAFDDSGATSSCIVEHRDRLYQFYTGWSLGVSVPFYFNIGLAVSDDGGDTFAKVSAAPVLGRHPVDPYLVVSPSVLVDNGLWRMWYVSGVRWTLENGAPRHYYHIKYAESNDGIDWDRTGRVCIDFKSDDEYAIARPCVVKDGDLYRMWYCCRGARYRIGYAESADGLRWSRKDEEAGIDVSASGWDAEMLCYPHVFDHDGARYMLYNGNGYGKSGIGLAILE